MRERIGVWASGNLGLSGTMALVLVDVVEGLVVVRVVPFLIVGRVRGLVAIEAFAARM